MKIQLTLTDGKTEYAAATDPDALDRLLNLTGEFSKGWVPLANGDFVRVESIKRAKEIG